LAIRKYAMNKGERIFFIDNLRIFLIGLVVLHHLSITYGASGSWTWQAASLAVWEQIVGFSLIIGLTGIFKKKFNRQSKVGSLLSGAAYAVFIIHPFVLVTISVMLKNLEVYPVIKFIMIAPVALFLCFGIGILLKKTPVVNRAI